MVHGPLRRLSISRRSTPGRAPRGTPTLRCTRPRGIGLIWRSRWVAAAKVWRDRAATSDEPRVAALVLLAFVVATACRGTVSAAAGQAASPVDLDAIAARLDPYVEKS